MTDESIDREMSEYTKRAARLDEARLAELEQLAAMRTRDAEIREESHRVWMAGNVDLPERVARAEAQDAERTALLAKEVNALNRIADALVRLVEKR